jgi:3-hydroxy acid dehydrogenase / malonic semialdehyde reductase
MTTTKLANQWVMITGASSGIGAATARAFGAEGAHLLLGARRRDRLEQVAAEAVKAGAASVRHHALDVGKTGSVNAFVTWLGQFTARVDVLINNAGGAHGLDPVATATDADWDAMVESNVTGLLRVTRAVLPLMRDQPGSSILNLGSIAGRTAYEGGAMYCGCKAAELMITRALRLELCGTGIRVASIDPGMVETEFSLVRFKGDAQRASKVYEGVRPLTAQDVAETLVWVASRPAHICIDEMIVKPTDQAAIYKVFRRSPAPGGQR